MRKFFICSFVFFMMASVAHARCTLVNGQEDALKELCGAIEVTPKNKQYNAAMIQLAVTQSNLNKNDKVSLCVARMKAVEELNKIAR